MCAVMALQKRGARSKNSKGDTIYCSKAKQSLKKVLVIREPFLVYENESISKEEKKRSSFLMGPLLSVSNQRGL